MNEKMNGQDADGKINDDNSSIIPTQSPKTETGPTTDYPSRKVMLRAERRDEIRITSVEQVFSDGDIPETLTVIERTDTYFGPELLLAEAGQNYLLTAPGPDTQLLLWDEIISERGYRQYWRRVAEVRTGIDEAPSYDICDQCEYPIRTEEHERLSLIGRCPERD